MKKKYLIPGLIVASILLVVYAIKGMFPFGNKFIAWGDMHAQILPLYYNFYDIVYNGKSLFIDFTSGTAANTLANFSYYIMSPFTLIILLFKRVDIPQAVSLIVLLKMALSAITCNYFLDKTFNKLNKFYKVFLSVLYALSTYNLSLYIITGWIDVVYLFPLLICGLLKLLNDKNPKMFIITLALSLIFNFYIAFMCLVFIFFGSLIYLYVYQKKYMKDRITLLGLSVLVSLLCSSVILIPTLIQVMSSARMGFSFSGLLTSGTGPLIDKFMYLTSSTFMLVCLIFLIINYKKNKKFLKFSIPCLILLTLPLIVEPINKMLHFGSYVYYPLRYGFILIFLLLIVASYYLSNAEIKIKDNKFKTFMAITSTIFCNILIIFITMKYYHILQEGVDKLTFSYNHKAFFIAILLAAINFVSYLIILLCSRSKTLKNVLLTISLLTFTITQSLVYIGIDYDEKNLHEVYNDLNYIYDQEFNKEFHFKKNEFILFENFGLVSNVSSQDFFTSLTDNNMFMNYQALGYDTNWMNTSSSGSNLFIDGILSNKYIISAKPLETELYDFKYNVSNINIYELKLPISKGYLIQNNAHIDQNLSSFENTNNIYNAITSEGRIITISNDFNKYNVIVNNDTISIENPEKEAFLEKEIYVGTKGIVYLDLLTSKINTEKVKINKAFDIYVNGIYYGEYPTRDNSGCINLGMYANQKVVIKLVLKKNVINYIKDISIGVLDYNKLVNYFENNKYDVIYVTSRYPSEIKISYYSNEEGIMFIPISFIDGMTVKNGVITKAFDSFIGFKVNKGDNKIIIKYETPGLKIGSIITLAGLVLSFLLCRFSNYLIKNNIINTIAKYTYIILFFIMLLIVYLIPGLLFIKSFL